MFDLVFEGKIAPGEDPGSVKRKLAKAMKLSDAQVERLFSGRQFRLKSRVDRGSAESLQQNLLRLGAQSQVLPSILDEPAQKTKPVAPPAPVEQHPRQHASSPQYQPIRRSGKTSGSRSFPNITLPLIGAVFLLLLGLAASIAFSPFPDGEIRRGFILGLVILLLGVRRFRLLPAGGASDE